MNQREWGNGGEKNIFLQLDINILKDWFLTVTENQQAIW